MVNVLTTLDVYIELFDIHLQGPTKQQNIRGIYSHILFQAGAKYGGGSLPTTRALENKKDLSDSQIVLIVFQLKAVHQRY